jgi:hypothetical protein
VTAPGWYPDPGGQGQRYHDGTAWTEQRAPAYVPPPPARKGPHPIVWVLLGLVLVPVLLFGGCAALVAIGMSSKDDTGSTSAAAATAGMNEPVSDGKLTFTVTEAKVMPYVGVSPRGQFFVVTMNVRNTGSEPQSFFIQNQKLFADGTEYASDTEAAYRVNSQGNTMVLDLNPGFDITVKVPFDVPKGVVPDRIEVHDSAFSGGASVSVS